MTWLMLGVVWGMLAIARHVVIAGSPFRTPSIRCVTDTCAEQSMHSTVDAHFRWI